MGTDDDPGVQFNEFCVSWHGFWRRVLGMLADRKGRLFWLALERVDSVSRSWVSARSDV